MKNKKRRERLFNKTRTLAGLNRIYEKWQSSFKYRRTYEKRYLSEHYCRLFLDYYFETNLFSQSGESISTTLSQIHENKEHFGKNHNKNDLFVTNGSSSISWTFSNKIMRIVPGFNSDGTLCFKLTFSKKFIMTSIYLRKILEITDPEKHQEGLDDWEQEQLAIESCKIFVGYMMITGS